MTQSEDREKVLEQSDCGGRVSWAGLSELPGQSPQGLDQELELQRRLEVRARCRVTGRSLSGVAGAASQQGGQQAQGVADVSACMAQEAGRGSLPRDKGAESPCPAHPSCPPNLGTGTRASLA